MSENLRCPGVPEAETFFHHLNPRRNFYHTWKELYTYTVIGKRNLADSIRSGISEKVKSQRFETSYNYDTYSIIVSWNTYSCQHHFVYFLGFATTPVNN